MKIEELSKYGIPEAYIERMREDKIHELYPPQADIVRKELLKERNLVISIPTAGGKTLLAALAIIKKFSQTKCKAIYIAPMVALAQEKYDYFKQMFGDKYRVSLSIGDLDSDDPWLQNQDVIVCTTEKLDSVTRHGAGWLGQVGLIIVDEIHTMNDAKRGPTLEILLTKLREMSPRAQILALSATIGNVKDLAKWLNANLVVSDFRPVRLYEGVAFDKKLQFYSHKTYPLPDVEVEAGIMQDTLRMKKQALFFLSSRRNAESLAERLAPTVKPLITSEEKSELKKLAEEIENVLETPSRQCSRLAYCISNGTAFHHAGLLPKQKRMIEENFRRGIVKVITSTPTLAMGVNLPAFRVVIRDSKRFSAGFGSSYIPVMEYKQMIGRAGRPKYDEFGEAILVAKSEDEAFEMSERFINGEIEEIRSKLAVEPVLRMHTLALIASGFCMTEKSILEFFSKTFYSFQYGDNSAIEDKISDIIGELVGWGFVESFRDGLSATKIGKRVSELYIDPLTAHDFVESLGRAAEKDHDYMSFLHMVCCSKEVEPKLNPKMGDLVEINGMIAGREKLFLNPVPEEWDLEFDDFVRSMRTSMLFESWMEEKTDDQILTSFNVAPGEMRNRIDTVDWLIYSAQELSMLLGHKKLISGIRKLRVRMKYGVKEELVPLVRLEGIGRVRARRLVKGNLRSLNDLRKVSIEVLDRILGPKVAASVKKQVGSERLLKDLESESGLSEGKPKRVPN